MLNNVYSELDENEEDVESHIFYEIIKSVDINMLQVLSSQGRPISDDELDGKYKKGNR